MADRNRAADDRLPEEVKEARRKMLARRMALDLIKRADPRKIKAFLDETIEGQEMAKRTCAMALSSHLLMISGKLLGKKNLSVPRTTLLLGPSGCGKTMIARRLAEYAGLPIVVADASQITADGWKGLNKADVLKRLFVEEEEKARYRVAEFGIVVLDEFDKLCFNSRGSAGNTPVEQNAVLGMLDGADIMLESKMPLENGTVYPTKDLLFILTGSFAGMQKMEEDEGRQRIGFGSDSPAAGGGYGKGELPDIVLRERLIKLGVIPELVGRIPYIAQLQYLTEDELFRAVSRSENSVVRQMQEVYRVAGIDIRMDERMIREAVREGMAGNMGVRQISSLLVRRMESMVLEAYGVEE